MHSINVETSVISERIVDAAAGLFRKKGYKGTTISDISHACRIGRKTLYDNFASKEDILSVVVWRELSELVDRANGNQSGIPSEIRLMELCRHILAGMAEDSGDIFFRALFSAENTVRRAAYTMLGGAVGGMYDDGRGEGVFKDIDTGIASDFVLACLRAARNIRGTADERYRLFNESLVMIARGIVDRRLRIEFRGFRKDYYRILGVAGDAAPEDIKQAYRAFAKQYHPDADRSGNTRISRYHDIRKAYDILGDQVRRLEYDAFLATPLSLHRAVLAYDFGD